MQGSVANGVQMHDIVRDLVRSRLGGEGGIRAKQRAVVAAFVAACPACGSWLADDAVGQYAGQALEQHMAEALLPSLLDDEEAQAWLVVPEAAAAVPTMGHQFDGVVMAAAATAAGPAKLQLLSAAKEAAGDLVGAAHIASAACSINQLVAATKIDFLYRAAALLERANSTTQEVWRFELGVLTAIWMGDIGSERYLKKEKRQEVLRAALLEAEEAETFATLMQRFFQGAGEAYAVWGMFMKPHPCPMEDVRNGHVILRKAAAEMARVSHHMLPAERVAGLLSTAMCLFFTSVTCDMGDWDPSLVGEAALVEALEFTRDVAVPTKCGVVIKANTGIDWFLMGSAAALLALYFGNVPAAAQWVCDAATLYSDLDLPKTKDYGSLVAEIHHTREILPFMVLHLDLAAEAQTLLGAMGFGWSDAGFSRYNDWFLAASKTFPNFGELPPGEIGSGTGEMAYHRLMVYLVVPKTAVVDAEFSDWVPPPAELAEIEKKSPWNFDFAFQGILHLAAEAFLKLGSDADAAEAARIAVSPDQQTRDPCTLAECHKVLGQVAAKRDEFDEADGHFTRALEAAKASRYAMLEVLVAQSWKRAVGENGAAGADAVIGAACGKMGKTLEQVDRR
jgi:hypothetical protein